jgi:hypothetical protein
VHLQYIFHLVQNLLWTCANRDSFVHFARDFWRHAFEQFLKLGKILVFIELVPPRRGLAVRTPEPPDEPD